MNSKIVRQVVNIVALIGMITVNVLANVLPINGQNSGEISDRFPVRFTPAGYVFSIWSVIYVALIAFVAYQALPAQRENRLINRIGWLFPLSCVLNASWLFAWHYNQFPLSMLIMLGLLGTLIAIYARIRSVEPVERRDHWLVRVPFSIYLGWITVATVANACIVLYNAGWNGLGISAEVWTVVLLVVALAITAFISLRLGDAAYGMVIVWAFAGIAVKQSDAQLVAVAAVIGAAIAALLVALAYFRSRPRLRLKLNAEAQGR